MEKLHTFYENQHIFDTYMYSAECFSIQAWNDEEKFSMKKCAFVKNILLFYWK